jgi:hypothetical protein
MGEGQQRLMELAQQYLPAGSVKTGSVINAIRSNPAILNALTNAGLGAAGGALGSALGSAAGSGAPEGHTADIPVHALRGALAGGVVGGLGGSLLGVQGGPARYLLPSVVAGVSGIDSFIEQRAPGRVGLLGLRQDTPIEEMEASRALEEAAVGDIYGSKTASVFTDPRVYGPVLGAVGGGGIGYLSGDKNVPGDTLKSTAIGAVLGGTTGGMAGMMARNSTRANEELQRAAMYFKEKALRASQLAEEEMMARRALEPVQATQPLVKAKFE